MINVSALQFLILVALSKEAKHGYAVLKEIERLTNGRYKVKSGSLYNSLKRCARNGWLTIEGTNRVKQSGIYRLTDEGRRVLQTELDVILGIIQ